MNNDTNNPQMFGSVIPNNISNDNVNVSQELNNSNNQNDSSVVMPGYENMVANNVEDNTNVVQTPPVQNIAPIPNTAPTPQTAPTTQDNNTILDVNNTTLYDTTNTINDKPVVKTTNKKKSVKINPELKTVIILLVIFLVIIYLVPTIFNFFINLKDNLS